MVFGKLLFGIILGNIASALANAEIRRVKYEEKLGAIQVVPVSFFFDAFSFLFFRHELIAMMFVIFQAHMSDQNIPGTLQTRVTNFYEFIWNKNRLVKLSSVNFFWGNINS